VKEWDKDCKIDITELGTESAKIPQVHNKYLKIYMGERIALYKYKGENKKIKRNLLEYYLGELDQDELDQMGRQQFYKKLLKNEVDVYIESDDMMIESVLRLGMQDEKVAYLDSIIKNINNRGFQLKTAVDWAKFTTG
jgi:ribonucleotide reductase alpha subunit